jgi:hypothetical protein
MVLEKERGSESLSARARPTEKSWETKIQTAFSKEVGSESRSERAFLMEKVWETQIQMAF